MAVSAMPVGRIADRARARLVAVAGVPAVPEVASVGRVAAVARVAAGGPVAVPRLHLPRGPGSFARALWPGVASGAVVPPRIARLGRRIRSSVSVVLAVTRGGPRLGRRGLRGGGAV